MKKRNLKNLNLNKKSISNLSKNEIKGGTVLTAFCWSNLSCPSLTCSEGVVCDFIKEKL
ncbi:hypothetical protein IMCC3317_43770 [Kordia antarctica]|uniref:Uncharacterized protein n=1 Tax=Kordia antarctica TaxID=1218801 RepID=A0A7L4ZR40_9FLAO|nr:hypothetical protein [Kordia antarctica]QHI38977.1 hypothetical protein IMCC3317_43770 [Kordia antarctica]